MDHRFVTAIVRKIISREWILYYVSQNEIDTLSSSWKTFWTRSIYCEVIIFLQLIRSHHVFYTFEQAIFFPRSLFFMFYTFTKRLTAMALFAITRFKKHVLKLKTISFFIGLTLLSTNIVFCYFFIIALSSFYATSRHRRLFKVEALVKHTFHVGLFWTSFL